MKIFRPLRLMLLALLCSLVPASSFAGIFISVGFAPPILPVYDQPPCPEEGLMWTPGYWAYGEDGYYWVPGTWVPVPYEGALWTPPYWGWDSGLYIFHPGYWGRHVGYYGGVNYGFGYMGIGFVGGMWRGHDFVYNTAVMRVDERSVHTTYMDRNIVERNTIVNDRHVAFSGGPGGIRHDAMPEERFAERDQHMDATGFQHSHESSAMSNRSMYVNNNGGHPGNAAVQRPWGGGNQGTGGADRSKSAHDAWSAPTRTEQNPGGAGNQGRGTYNPSPSGNNNPPGNYNNRPSGNYNERPAVNNNPPANNNPSNRGNSDSRTYNASHSNTGNAPAQPSAPQPQPQYHPAPQPQPQPQYHPAPQPQPQSHPAPPPQQHGGSQQHNDKNDKTDHPH